MNIAVIVTYNIYFDSRFSSMWYSLNSYAYFLLAYSSVAVNSAINQHEIK